MYLAPLNYDRFFERVFRDLYVSKQFLEDILNVVIEEIEYLPRKNKIIDDGSFVEFDFRCKINGQYAIVDMQQWYKSDVVKRFYMYFCNNTSLQLERIPDLSIPIASHKEYKTKYYDYVEPSITIIWMADDTLGFDEDIVAFSLFPEQLNEFIRNEALWQVGSEAALLEQRKKVLEILNNKTKKLDFLPKNRLIFAFQNNIVKNKSLEEYHWWFDFAAATKRPNNKKADFNLFLDKPVFVKIMEKIVFKNLETDDFQYITDYPAFEKRLALYNEKVRKEGYEEAQQDFEPVILMKNLQIQRIEEEKQRIEAENQRVEAENQRIEAENQRIEAENQRIEAEKRHIEAEKQMAEQGQQLAEAKANHFENKQIQGIKKRLKRGDSFDEIADLYDLDKESLQQIIDKIDFA